MTEQNITQTRCDLYGNTASAQCVRQVADLLQKQFTPLRARFANGKSFESGPGTERRQGINAFRGELVENDVLAVQLECARMDSDLRVPVAALFTQLADLGEKCRVVTPSVSAQDGMTELRIEMRIEATPLSIAREEAFIAKLGGLDKLAQAIQSEIPQLKNDKDLAKLYERHADFLEPVHPWYGKLRDLPAALAEWITETLEFIEGGRSVAIECGFPLGTQFLLSVLARAATDFGRSLGAVTPTSIAAKSLVDVARKSPGIVAIPAIRVSLGTSAYEMANEIACMLASLSSAGTPVIFTGSQDQLQSVFGGGQGGGNDPLHPVLRHAPEVAIEVLTRFAVLTAGLRTGGLAARTIEHLVKSTLDAISNLPTAAQRRALDSVALRAVSAHSKGQRNSQKSLETYAATLAGVSETLSGLSPRPRATRAAHVQDRFVTVLTDRHLFNYFGEHLLAQDAALEQLVARLNMETLTRPPHQPLRYCAQGTPGTGKSESAILLARRLGVPHANIDAASMPDYYTAAAQLLGSGRGIVGSFQSGRLEQVAKCHTGAVLEISDLDHAVPSVRSALADLFLQILETGEGQSATGAMFSCANLILAFTMNLPDGMDEKVRRRIGFTDYLTRREITADVSEHIKRMLSGAFLSRVGTPVLFEPLNGTALAMIVERAIKAAIMSAASHLRAGINGVVLEDGLGRRAIELLESRVVCYGARALLEHGRCLASRAFLDLREKTPDLTGSTLRVLFNDEGNILIRAG